jgi:hypothetical protein
LLRRLKIAAASLLLPPRFARMYYRSSLRTRRARRSQHVSAPERRPKCRLCIHAGWPLPSARSCFSGNRTLVPGIQPCARRIADQRRDRRGLGVDLGEQPPLQAGPDECRRWRRELKE